MILHLIRPPDIHVGPLSADLYGFFFLLSSFFLSSFFVMYFPRSLNGNETKRVTCSEVNVILKCMSKIWGIPCPKNRGPKTHLFRGFWNLAANLTAYIFGTQHDIHKRGSVLRTTRGLLHRLKTTSTLVHKWRQIGSEFSPTLREFCIPLYCQASQTEFSKRNSTKLCQTVVRRSH